MRRFAYILPSKTAQIHCGAGLLLFLRKPDLEASGSTSRSRGASRYRPEIDGLRAFAVIAVIINHFNKDALPSGYLGVDIFFVISGFVITSSLLGRESKNFGDFLAGFYERRIKRLVPALVIFVLATSLLICLFNPEPGVALGLGWRSLFGISNIRLYRSSTDYFAESTDLNPFVHTWSLGVEEQFYILFPFLIWFSGFGRQTVRGARNLFWMVGTLSIASAIGYIYLSQVNQPASYFLMPPRFWEMSAGCLVFLALHRRAWIGDLLQKIPTTLIAISMIGVMFLPVSKAVPATFSIVLLTGLLIGSLRAGTVVFKFLTIEKVVYIGLISYSLYLWHWGVLSISRWTIGIHWWSVPFQLGLMFAIAIASYKWVETPLRRANWSVFRWQTLGYGLGASTFGALAIYGFIKGRPFNLFVGRNPDLLARGVSSLTTPYTTRDKNGNSYRWDGKSCVLSSNDEVGKRIPIANCTLGNFDESDQRVLIIGNSFSASFVQAFDQKFVESGYATMITSSWGASPVKEIKNTSVWNKANDYYWSSVVPNLVKELRPGDIVLMINDMASFSPKNQTAKSAVRLSQLDKGLRAFASELKKRDIGLAILHGLPLAREANCDPASAIPQWYQPFGQKNCNMPSKRETLARRKNLSEMLNKLSDQVTTVDLIDIFCPTQRCTYLSGDGKVLYRDEFSHPSVEAVKLSQSRLLEIIKNMSASS
jgi:peptidoglycan/LPS O-acetylase OafA/YrhL